MLETTLGRVLFNETLPLDYPFVNYEVDKKASSRRSSTTSPSATRRCRWRRRWTRSRRPASTGPPGPGVTIAHRRRRHAAAQAARSSSGYEKEAEQGRRAVRARPDHRRRASPGAHRDLDQGDQRGRQGDGGQRSRRPTRSADDGPLGCPRQHDADAPDRRHAWPGGQPEGRDHPAADQVQLPRGPVGAGVLHLHPRCPQGSGRHRAAYRRLGLPDPASGGRLAGRHHPRGGLRHRARPPDADRGRGRRRRAATRTTHVETSVYAPHRWPTTSSTPTGNARRRARHRPRRRPDRRAGRGRRRDGPGALAC